MLKRTFLLALLASGSLPLAAQPLHESKCGPHEKCVSGLPVPVSARFSNAVTQLGTSRVTVSALDARDRSMLLLFKAPGHLGGGWHLAGESGTPYVLALRNETDRRLLVVPSVDGVNVITGQTASPSQSGYILEPYGVVHIDGWRKSLNEVARFVFSSPSQSYAGRTDRPENVGVIGIAVFEEARPVVPMPAPPIASLPAPGARADRAGAGSAELEKSMRAQSAPAPSLGTAHGEREASQARRGRFERASAQPDEVIRLDYERLDVLVQRGVAVPMRVVRPAAPNLRDPFPAQQFVPDPPRR